MSTPEDFVYLSKNQRYDAQWREEKHRQLDQRIVDILDRDGPIDEKMDRLQNMENRYQKLIEKTKASSATAQKPDDYLEFLREAFSKTHAVTAVLLAGRIRGMKALESKYGESIYDAKWLSQPENIEAQNAFNRIDTMQRGAEVLDIAIEHLRQKEFGEGASVLDMLEKLFTNS